MENLSKKYKFLAGRNKFVNTTVLVVRAVQPTEQNTLTHTSAVSWRRLVNAAWSAPANFTGRVVFRATLVEEYRVRLEYALT